MTDSIKINLVNAYMRGFRAGASGDRSQETLDGVRRHPGSAYTRGYCFGRIVAVDAEREAMRHAERVADSLAVEQAERNARAGS